MPQTGQVTFGRAGEIAPAHWFTGPGEAGAGKAGLGEAGAGNAGLGEAGAGKAGLGETGSREAGSAEVLGLPVRRA
jgi:hypothetical protein